MNTQIKTWVGTVIIIIVAITTGAFVWVYEKNQPEIAQPQIQTSVRQKNTNTVGVANPASVNCTKNGGTLEIRTGADGGQTGFCKFSDGSECEEWAYMRGECKSGNAQAIKSNFDFSNIQFDACGKIDKYNKLTWWNDFKNKAEQIKYYSDNYIETELQRARDNTYLNPTKINYNYDQYCTDKNFKDSVICGAGKLKKISISDDFGEGCLSKDGTVFLAVFPGEYMGGGNYIIRYLTAENVADITTKINEKLGDAWFAVPREFLKRNGNIIKMMGRDGDAGAGEENTYDYDFVKNEVKLTKSCNIGEGAKPGDCTNY